MPAPCAWCSAAARAVSQWRRYARCRVLREATEDGRGYGTGPCSPSPCSSCSVWVRGGVLWQSETSQGCGRLRCERANTTNCMRTARRALIPGAGAPPGRCEGRRARHQKRRPTAVDRRATAQDRVTGPRFPKSAVWVVDDKKKSKRYRKNLGHLPQPLTPCAGAWRARRGRASERAMFDDAQHYV